MATQTIISSSPGPTTLLALSPESIFLRPSNSQKSEDFLYEKLRARDFQSIQDLQKMAPVIRSWAVEQLVTNWQRTKDIDNYPPLWGDELEYMLVKFDEDDRSAHLALRQKDVLDKSFQELEENGGPNSSSPLFELQPEFGAFQVEAIPENPYGITLKDLLSVEKSMRQRRNQIAGYLKSDEAPMSLPCYPRLGATGNFTSPKISRTSEKFKSQFISDDIFSHYPRYSDVAANLQKRRGRHVEVNLPVFRDENTPWPFNDPTVDHSLFAESEKNVRPNCVYGDHMVFGGGGCGFQTTFQARNITEARMLHDQLTPLGPIFLAMSAGSPMFKGFLVDTDARWNTLTQVLDDRRPIERENGADITDYTRTRARWGTNSTYIADDHRLRAEYLLKNVPRNEAVQHRLCAEGIDPLLAAHYAQTLNFDPLTVSKEDLRSSSPEMTHHFEKLYCTVWPHVRFKNPPTAVNPKMGWRIEFRPTEIQATDFENAAFAVFLSLLWRTIVDLGLNFYIPMEKVGENMRKAHSRDAVNREKFWFRKNPTSSKVNGESLVNGADNDYHLMTLNEIVNGSATNGFPGLLPLIRENIKSMDGEVAESSEIKRYLDFIGKRASGEYWTLAKWMRDFVRSHPEYNKDSVVSQEVCYDLLKKIRDVSAGKDTNKEMYGELNIHL